MCARVCSIVWQRWVVLRKTGMWLYASPVDTEPLHVLFFDTSFFLLSGPRVSGSLDSIVVAGSNWVMELKCGSELAARDWGAAVNAANSCNEWTRANR
jgi:hypothetical protein